MKIFFLRFFSLSEKIKIPAIVLKKPKTFLYFGAFLLSFLSLFFIKKNPSLSSSTFSSNKSHLLKKKESLDTFIPRGFVLIPIELENQRSLESALGGYGVVDLYASSKNPPNDFELIVKNIQILRSPYPPYEFAVMSPEEKAKLILQFDGIFKVAIKNPKKTGMHFEKEPMREKEVEVKRKIIIDSEE